MEKNIFKSIIGYAEVKRELAQILDQLRNPGKYTALGVTQTHGLLLHDLSVSHLLHLLSCQWRPVEI